MASDSRVAVRMSISLKPEMLQVLKEDSSAMGLSMSGYISMLLANARKEGNALKMVQALTPEQLRNAVDKIR